MPSSSVQRRSSSRQVESRTPNQPGAPGSIFTTLLLALILLSGPMLLGAARLWVELPLLGGVAALIFFQGMRLSTRLSRSEVRQLDAIDFSVLAFTLYTVARWLTSPSEYFSRLEMLEVVGCAALFLTCRYGMARRTYSLWLLYALVALGVGETIFGYYLSEHLDWFPFGTTERLQLHYAPRWLGTYGCPNHFGGLLVMAIGAAIALGCFSKLSWPLRIVMFYLTIMMIVGLMFSGSRGSWIAGAASIVALVVFGLRHGTVRGWVPVTGAVLLFVAAIYGFSQAQVVKDRLNEAQDTLETGALGKYVRVQLAMDALHIARDHPLFGTGPGTFVFMHPRYQSSTFGFKAVLTHDDYLNCLDDYGLVGLGLALFFVFAVTLKFFHPLIGDNRWPDRVLVATGFAAWVALLVHSWIDFNLHIPANAHLFFALIGLALARLKAEEAGHWSTVSLAPLGPFLGWSVLVLSIAYGVMVTRAAVGDLGYETVLANVHSASTPDSIKNAEDALTYDPGNAQDLVLLGDLYRYQASRQKDMDSRVYYGRKALDAYQRALKANALDDTVQARMGMTFDVMKRYSEAFFCYETAVKARPSDGQFWYWLGNHYWQRGLLPRAEISYLRGEKCPHGFDGCAEAVAELRALPQMKDVPQPPVDADPLAPLPQAQEPPTTP